MERPEVKRLAPCSRCGRPDPKIKGDGSVILIRCASMGCAYSPSAASRVEHYPDAPGIEGVNEAADMWNGMQQRRRQKHAVRYVPPK